VCGAEWGLSMKALWQKFQALDPRIPVAFILFLYLVLGLTVLGFNRSPWQAVITTALCLSLEVMLTRIFYKKWIFPLSALITSFSLSFLLNYSHSSAMILLPVLLAIGSKYLLRYNGKHLSKSGWSPSSGTAAGRNSAAA
jgi:hypothetical protein